MSVMEVHFLLYTVFTSTVFTINFFFLPIQLSWFLIGIQNTVLYEFRDELCPDPLSNNIDFVWRVFYNLKFFPFLRIFQFYGNWCVPYPNTFPHAFLDLTYFARSVQRDRFFVLQLQYYVFSRTAFSALRRADFSMIFLIIFSLFTRLQREDERTCFSR